MNTIHKYHKSTPRVYHIPSIKIEFAKLLKYSILTAISILIGSILQIIFIFDIDKIGKDSILTGLPVIRKAFFMFPLLINFLFFIWLIIIFRQEEISSTFNHNILRFMYKLRGIFIFTNFTHLLMFYFGYNYLYIPLWESHEFKLSGHVLACLFSGAVLTNLETIFETFKKENLKNDLMVFLIRVCKFFSYHNFYSILWTAWIFHRPRETIVSFFVGFFWVVLINYLNLDKIIIKLVDNQTRNEIKEKNKIYVR